MAISTSCIPVSSGGEIDRLAVIKLIWLSNDSNGLTVNFAKTWETNTTRAAINPTMAWIPKLSAEEFVKKAFEF
jgi:hypothetical protein